MDQALFFTRFGTAVVFCAIAYLSLAIMLVKFEDGLYTETETPWGKPDAAHKRARRTFDLLSLLVLLVVGLYAYCAHLWMSPMHWTTFGWPGAVGGAFAMLYAAGTRRDRARPRKRAA